MLLIILAGCGQAAPTQILPAATHAQASLTPTLLPATRIAEPTQTPIPTLAPSPTLQPVEINRTNYQHVLDQAQSTIDLGGLILSLDMTGDGNYLAASRDGEILVLDGESFAIYQTLTVNSLTNALDFSPDDSRLLASGSNDGYVRIWDWETGVLVREHSAHPKGVTQISFQPGGSLLVSAGNDALVQLWDTATGENRGYLIGGAFAVPDLAFLPGGSQLLTVDGGVIRVREVEGGRLVASIRVGDSVPVIVPGPSGAWVAASIKPAVLQIWGLAGSELLSEVHLVDLRDVWAMALNPAGDLLAVGGRDGSICLVPTDALADYACQRVSERPISALAFLTDGRGLISGGYDGVLNLWQVLQ